GQSAESRTIRRGTSHYDGALPCKKAKFAATQILLFCRKKEQQNIKYLHILTTQTLKRKRPDFGLYLLYIRLGVCSREVILLTIEERYLDMRR
ncbi:MAG: hypothetical protein KKH29_05185, partial [Candidatus Omnitrophica bacterium]|nr:hypothetical protein [Candidatus Omnitrophota bacterium]